MSRCHGLLVFVAVTTSCMGRVTGPAIESGEVPTNNDDPPPDKVGTAIPRGGLQRLSARQISNTIADVFGPKFATDLAIEIDYRSEGFTSVGGREVAVSSSGARKYEQSAAQLADAVMSDVTQRARWVTCTPSAPQDLSCMKSFVASVGRRLWRRPLTDEETSRFAKVGDAAANALSDFHKGARYALAGLLLSPNFVYHVERGEPTPQRSRLTPYEIASRLSYFLWGTTPDDELLSAAEDGSLNNEEGLSRQVDRLLANSARIGEGLRGFVDGYLGLYLLADAPKDFIKFPNATATTKAAMVRAVYELVNDVWVREQRPVADIFEPGYVFANQHNGPVLGLAAKTDEFVRAPLPSEGLRVGVLTEPAVLAATSRQKETSPTLRGKFINELLCEVVPAAPADLDTTLAERPMGTTRRQQIEGHMKNPACSGCHQVMDPVGFGLENFDAMGAVQLQDNGVNVDASGSLGDRAFSGPRDLSRLVANDERLVPCLSRRVLTHALGRLPLPAEEESLLTRLASEPQVLFTRMLRAVALSPSFPLAPSL